MAISPGQPASLAPEIPNFHGTISNTLDGLPVSIGVLPNQQCQSNEGTTQQNYRYETSYIKKQTLKVEVVAWT